MLLAVTPGSSSGSKAVMTPRRRRSRAFDSPHLAASLSSARNRGKEELLHEAELEIVESRRSRSRSVLSRLDYGWESDDSEAVLPGGWKRSPRKRKRRVYRPLQSEYDESENIALASTGVSERRDGRSWGVKEWKRLEKIFKAERTAWAEARDVRPVSNLSSPFWGWIQNVRVVQVEEWDADRVVSRFLDTEGVQSDLGGEWNRFV